eukprot:CAMPEP_0196804612 /NCGR_PEP_ID=MMETSP1362-20130617/4260_1 /TAXON_ID=163516 /ORGANISM="Leptocylindrus danicus, Strain CCMP1856" /LENGTH=38 /DNA_ID= /DNA_START= /DNA_END= /DNA_ORIENTATION=
MTIVLICTAGNIIEIFVIIINCGVESKHLNPNGGGSKA